jgi:gliding motility-associated-like protein
MVFYSDGYTNPWDGTYNGKPLPSGTYYYVIDLGNGDVPYKGDVTIIR